MSNTIDERIVEMRFDNRQFEQNVQTSLSTLERLKRGLDLDGASKGLDNLGAAAKKCDVSILGNSVETVRAKFSAMEVVAMTTLSNITNSAVNMGKMGAAAKKCDVSILGNSVETVRAKFSAMEVVAMTTLSNITNSAVNMGKRMVSALTIDPIKTGFQEYETQIGAVQTILANTSTLSNITNSAVNMGKRMVSALTIDPIKTGFQEYETQIGAVQTILANTSHEGTNLQQVNRALDELNTYADKTIYNFTEMTRNIGTFTAAGVNLRTSVDSIKGIANLAAISGSTSQQASTAMYQLSQALAAGKVSLMDWNSVVNAGMGGKVFQDALVRTSELLGTGAQNAINMYGSFRESLTKGEWLTTEVLTETLKQFAGAYSEADLIQGTGAQNAINMYGSFRESLTKGEWLTTEVLTETLKQFAGAYSEADLIQQGFSEKQAREIAQMAESLTKGEWLTTEVLTETLKQFAGAYSEADLIQQGFSEKQAREIAQMAKTAEEAATKVKTFTQLWDTLKESAQSGWTTTWEILVGDFEEAKELLTEVSDVVGGMIGEMSNARNELLSGGLSSGWKQLLNQGIADEAGFIEEIRAEAQKSGDAFEKMAAKSESFTDALKKGLSEGVISSDTLTNSVHNLRDKMTAMSQEELKAAGYTSEMVKQIKELDDGLQNGSVSMDEFVEKILRPSGRENLIQSLWNAAKGLMSVITPIKDAFREIFPPATADQLYSLTETLRKFSERLTLSDAAADKLKRTFKGSFAMLDLLHQGFMAVLKALSPLVGGARSLADAILSVTATIGDFWVGLHKAAEEGQVFQHISEGIATVLGFVSSAIQGFFGLLSKVFSFPGLEGLQQILQNIQTRIGQVIDAVTGLGSGTRKAAGEMDSAMEGSKFLQMLQSIFNGAKTLVTGILDVFGGLASGIVEALSGADFSGALDLLNSISLGGIAFGITKFMTSLTKAFDDVGGLLDNVKNILDGVRGCFEAYQSQLKADALLKIASAKLPVPLLFWQDLS